MKTYEKIVLAGGTGQIGKAIINQLGNRTKEIIVLSRSPKISEGNTKTVFWNGLSLGEWVKELEGAELLINLTGKNVNCRYNSRNKKEILSSRISSVNVLAEAIKQCKVAPTLWVQITSATIYRHSEDKEMTEANGEIGTGFSVDVCKLWESAFVEKTKELGGLRKAILRTSLVLGSHEGVFPRLNNLVNFGLGGRQGSGKQMVSWIHESDVVGIIEWIAANQEANGIYNSTAPEPLTNDTFMETIRRVLNNPLGIVSPKWLLELGAFIIGTETELVLKSRWVVPERLVSGGYVFRFPQLRQAIENIVHQKL